MATRYTDEKKKEVVNFVKEYDAKNGRGGQSAAKKKYKINPISIKKWCVEQGVAGPSKKAKKTTAAKPKAKASTGAKRGPKKGSTRRGRKPAAAAAAKAPAPATKSNASMTAKLKKMSDLSEKIDALQAQFDELKKSL